MKRNAQSPLYFSAYPLKAITEKTGAQSSSNQSPYLRSVLAGKSKSSSRVRVFPMANPYLPKQVTSKRVRLAKDVEGSGDAWYNHYE